MSAINRLQRDTEVLKNWVLLVAFIAVLLFVPTGGDKSWMQSLDAAEILTDYLRVLLLWCR